jgi:hypothetical protein
MPDENGNNAPPPSLRDIAEAAYDEVEQSAREQDQPVSPEAPSEGPPGDVPQETIAPDDRPRDKQGRWVAKSSQPGEADVPRVPAPPKIPETQAPAPDPAAAQAPRSNQAPEHWSAEDKATFAKLPQEGQAFLLKRHGEMEAEFTRKSQASAGAVQFTQALAPTFTDAAVMAMLKKEGTSPVQAIQQWAHFYKMGNSERQEDKFTLLVDLTQRMGLDPARIFAALQNQSPSGPQGIPEEALKDPAVRYVADQLGRISNEQQRLRAEFQQRQDAERQAREQQGVQSARQNIDVFADEKDASGRPLRPHFDAVLPFIIDLFRVNPNRDIAEAYETACWAHPEVRKQLLAATRQRDQSAQDLQKARVAVRSNARGVSAPAVRPPSPDGPSKGSLRDAIEKSADEIGL